VNKVADAIVDILLGFEPELPKPPVLMYLGTILSADGIQEAADRYRRLQETGADQFDFGLEQFLDIGYTLLEVRRYAECFRILQLALKLFPDAPEIANLLKQLKSRVSKA
jgi:hypothetical protein